MKAQHKINQEEDSLNASITQDLKVVSIKTVHSGLVQERISKLILKTAIILNKMLEGAEVGRVNLTLAAKETMTTTMRHQENEAAEDKDAFRGAVVAREITQRTQMTTKHHEVAEDMDVARGVVGGNKI